MGDALGGIFGSGGKQTTDVTLDPQSEAANKLRLQQLQSLFSTTPLNAFAVPRADIYTGSPSVDALFATANTGVGKDADLSNLMSFDDYVKMGLDEGSNYINKVAKPEIIQIAALQGLESGGFVEEAIAKATAGIALPFLQGLPSASAALTTAGPQANVLTSQRDVLGAQRAQVLFPLADYQRALSQEDFLRQQQVSLAGLTGIPFTAATDTTAKKSSQPFFNFFGQG